MKRKLAFILWYRKVYRAYHCENCCKLLPKAIFLMFLVFCCGVAYSETKPISKYELAAFVGRAVNFARVNGKASALGEFMNTKGEFFKGELYIFAYDFQGTVLAHGGQPELVGQNLIDMKDANGVEVVKELIKLAQQGGGWLQYLWPNPAHNNQVETKLGYVMKVDKDWFLGSGIYKASDGKKTK